MSGLEQVERETRGEQSGEGGRKRAEQRKLEEV
jgi:hypothetical protein